MFNTLSVVGGFPLLVQTSPFRPVYSELLFFWSVSFSSLPEFLDLKHFAGRPI